jgi:hypothetical protein
MSNEGACYRHCGCHFDNVTCGLPRHQSVSVVRLSTNSTREIHELALALLSVIKEVQRIVTYAEHVEQIFTETITGGFTPEVHVIEFTFSPAFTLRFRSADAITNAVTYARTFRIGLSTDRAWPSLSPPPSTPAIDGFASAARIESALNTLLSTVGTTNSSVLSVRVTRELRYEEGVLRWQVTFLRLVASDLGYPTLRATLDVPFEGALTTRLLAAVSPPSGSFLLRYGPTETETAEIAVVSSTGDVEAVLRHLEAVYAVRVSRHDVSSQYGIRYGITFVSVDHYYTLVTASTAAMVRAVGATDKPTVPIRE